MKSNDEKEKGKYKVKCVFDNTKENIELVLLDCFRNFVRLKKNG